MNMTENYNKSLTAEQKAKLRRIKHLALDMDGTIYMENNIFPFTVEVLDTMKRNRGGIFILDEQPTKSVEDYLKKLAGNGDSRR